MKVFFTLFLALAAAFAGETKLGKPLALKEATGIGEIAAQPDRYAGKTLQVKGTVRDVCRKMGCWMELADQASGKTLRIKVKDGEIVFPKEAIGKTAVVEGKLAKLELTKEQAIAMARHEAEANGRKFDPASITSAQTIYQIQGTGAVIFD